MKSEEKSWCKSGISENMEIKEGQNRKKKIFSSNEHRRRFILDVVSVFASLN